ncbi:TauD/TfdA dioxygenase family protein [Frateuria sp. GZRe12]|uniref:TauD/TfdA dioxygenase family protein n=1 Tax=Frateuria sp. GZRe12 TaxID=3351533 RepID=UPI003EDBB5FF
MRLKSYSIGSVRVHPFSPFGAEIKGIRANDVAPEAAAGLREALVRHQVLVIRDQDLPPADQVKLTECFGTLESSLSLRPEDHQVAGYPHVLLLSNKPNSSTANYGMGWHSDGLAYAKVPHGITMLYCLSCPKAAGDTVFADQYSSYSAMSEGMRRLLEGLYWHLPRIPYSEVPPSAGLVQPFIRRHSISGRQFLFFAPAARQIRGMTVFESAGILDTVRQYQVHRDFVYRHSWNKGDIVIWENQTLLHSKADAVDPDKQGLRAMHRTATKGAYEAIKCEPAEAD